jgi:hypothetical protein
MPLEIKTNRLTLSLLFLLISQGVFGQNEANIWYFGHNAGLDFNRKGPAALQNSAMETRGSSAVISHSQTGELLFYSNGEKIWNRHHEVMTNGDGIFGSHTAAQCALIIPVPEVSTQFYLFTIQIKDSKTGYANMYYSLIDMSVNGGDGNVVFKNVLVVEDITNSMSAVQHSNGQDFWLVAHSAIGNLFYSIPIYREGPGEPLKTQVGSDYSKAHETSEIKFSPDGTKIVSGMGGAFVTSLDLFDFNSQNGTIGNYRQIASLTSQHGRTFSPDSKLLYVTGMDIEYLNESGDIGDYIYQLDVSLSTTQEIINSKTPLFSNRNTVTDIGSYAALLASGMQIGPDGRIYVAGNITIQGGSGQIIESSSNSLVVIENPNKKGYDCYVTIRFFDFQSGQVFNGLPNFVQSIFRSRVPQDEELPCNDAYAYSIYPNPVKDFFKIRVQQECFQPYNFSLYNSLGQLLNEGFVFTRESELIDVRPLSAGIYLLYFNLDGKAVVKKILKID